MHPFSRILTDTIRSQLKKLSVHNKPYRLNLLDTAGQERFRTLSNSYYRGAHGVLLVYDISNRDSFLSMERWFDEVESNAQEGIVMVLVGSKLDKATNSTGGRGDRRKVSYEEGQRLAQKFGAGFWECSAKTRENVKAPFLEVVERIVASPGLVQNQRSRTGIAIGGSDEAGGCAC
jgi:Ras-related protein Rab-18